MVFGRKKKKDAEAEAIMDQILAATGETDLTADPDAPKPKIKKKKPSSQDRKGKQVTDNPLVLYGEKIALTLAILASGFLIYSGMNAGKDNMGQTFNKTADQLDEQIRTANSAISNGDWDQEKETYTTDTEQSFEQRAVADNFALFCVYNHQAVVESGQYIEPFTSLIQRHTGRAAAG